MSTYVPPPPDFPGPNFTTPPTLKPPAALDDKARREIKAWDVKQVADVLEHMHHRACSSYPGRWFGKATCGEQCHLTPDERLIYNFLVRELEDRQPEVVAWGIHCLSKGRTPGLYYQYVTSLIGDVYDCNDDFSGSGWYINAPELHLMQEPVGE